MTSTISLNPFLAGYFIGSFLTFVLMVFGVLDIALHYLVIAICGGGMLSGFVAMMLNNWLVASG